MMFTPCRPVVPEESLLILTWQQPHSPVPDTENVDRAKLNTRRYFEPSHLPGCAVKLCEAVNDYQ